MSKDVVMINWKRTIALSISDKKSPVEKALKTAEETGEMAEAVLSVFGAHACGYKNKSKQDVLEESIDVIQVAISVIAKSFEKEGFPEGAFVQMFERKLDRWEEKQREDL